MTLEPKSREGWPREGWPRAAWVTAGLMLLVLVTVAARPGAPLGPLAYGLGLPLVGTLALLQILYGLVCSLRRPPVVSPVRLRAFLVLAATAFLAVLPIPYPSSHAARPSAVTFALPVQGTWEVVLGGDRPFDNTLVLSPQLRYALVLSRAPGEDAEPVFGAPVFAPADGRVVEVETGLPDEPSDVSHQGGPPPHPAGNRVVLEVAEGQYLFLVGLHEDSPLVSVGDRVMRGQLLGRVGRSADLAPGGADHLVFHLQDRPTWGEGEGIPWRFGPYAVLPPGVDADTGDPAWQAVERGRPGHGERIRSGLPAPD